MNFSNAKQGSVQLMQCYLVEFLFSLIRSNENSMQPMHNDRDSHRMAENALAASIVSFIEAHLSEPASLQRLCVHFCISRTYLCRIFKDSTGTSPVSYWIDLKIKEAKRLIRESEQNMTPIAHSLGYSGIHHFTRMFKQVTGLSPMAYKTSVGIS